MSERLEPDPQHPGSFLVRFGGAAQSYVDPEDPLRLEFEYVQRICETLEVTVLTRPVEERIRVVHIGGGGLTIPRWVEARRPQTAQIVLEPDAELTEEVRRKAPLPKRSGIKVRAVAGRPGVAEMPLGYTDAVVLDAFADARVPADLASEEFLGEVAGRLRPGGLLAANITDHAPFYWAKRFTAGVAAHWSHVLVAAEPATWKGRRFGNLVVVGSGVPLPGDGLARTFAASAFPYRLLAGRELRRWLGGAEPWTDADAVASPGPPGGRSWYS